MTMDECGCLADPSNAGGRSPPIRRIAVFYWSDRLMTIRSLRCYHGDPMEFHEESRRSFSLDTLTLFLAENPDFSAIRKTGVILSQTSDFG